MIIWINGAYGVGKSTIAGELHKALPDSYLYDPEEAGNFIRENIPDLMWKDDFQEYALWRDLNYKMISFILSECTNPLIVPMTIIRAASYTELVNKLMKDTNDVKHFILHASKETLLQRNLDRGEQADSWCIRHIDPCIEAFKNSIQGIDIDTDNRQVDAITKEILNYL